MGTWLVDWVREWEEKGFEGWKSQAVCPAGLPTGSIGNTNLPVTGSLLIMLTGRETGLDLADDDVDGRGADS
jgi:hypothetical protein